MVGPRQTICIDKPLINGHLDEVGWLWIERLAEGNNFAHWLIVPVGEWTDDMRNVSRLDRLKMWVDISHVIHLLLVVLLTVWIFNL